MNSGFKYIKVEEVAAVAVAVLLVVSESGAVEEEGKLGLTARGHRSSPVSSVDGQRVKEAQSITSPLGVAVSSSSTLNITLWNFQVHLKHRIKLQTEKNRQQEQQ